MMNVANRETEKRTNTRNSLKNVIGILSKMHINRFKGHTSIRVKIIHLDQKGKTYQNLFVCVALCVRFDLFLYMYMCA